MGQYASETNVSPERSVAEIRNTLRRYGAEAFSYGEASRPARAFLEFDMHDRRVRFLIGLPEKAEFRLTPQGRERPASAIEKEWEQAIRQRWRSLALIVKAKLVAVDEGVVEFEQEFALHFVMSDGRTVYEELRPHLNQVCSISSMPALMPGSHAS